MTVTVRGFGDLLLFVLAFIEITSSFPFLEATSKFEEEKSTQVAQEDLRFPSFARLQNWFFEEENENRLRFMARKRCEMRQVIHQISFGNSLGDFQKRCVLE